MASSIESTTVSHTPLPDPRPGRPSRGLGAIPDDFVVAAADAFIAGDDEEEVGEAVDVRHDLCGQRIELIERAQATFSASSGYARLMTEGRYFRAAGKDKVTFAISH